MDWANFRFLIFDFRLNGHWGAQFLRSDVVNRKSKIKNQKSHSGIVLHAVLVVLAMAAMIGSGLVFRVQAETAAMAAVADGQQAYMAAMSGLQRAMAVAAADPADRAAWWDNQELFKNQLVFDDGVARWYFTIYADDPADDQNVRYGLTDEASKINVNMPVDQLADLLAALPNMTAERVDCLCDYLDADDQTRPAGAEQDAYDGLSRAWVVRNGPLGTIHELLRVKGFDAALVFGEDVNRNGLMEANENDGPDSSPDDDADGVLDTGLATYLTTFSREGVEVDEKGSETGGDKIDLNGDVDEIRQAQADAELIDFIVLFRLEGGTFSHPSELLGMRYVLTEDHETRAAGETIESPVTEANLPAVLDRFTASQESSGSAGRVGRVNVNTASATVLAALPGIDAEAARRIIQARDQLEPDVRTDPAWLLREHLITEADYKALAPLVTGRSEQFHVRCIGFGYPVGRFRVLEALIDLASSPGRIVYLRDVTRLGLPAAIHVEEENS